jgi:release factor glutamine methyltransferase
MRTTINLAEWLGHARQVVSPLSEHPSLEAQVLLAHVLNKPRSWVLSYPEYRITPIQEADLSTLLDRLSNGVPLPYLTGQQEFYGLPFLVNPDVLIPRPETELLVEHAAAWLIAHPGRRQCVDVGTGSGCIAISLAYHHPAIRMVAVDRSHQALFVAKENARRNGVDGQIDLIQADLLDGLSGSFDLICANLPYIPSETLSGLPVSRYEPRLALDGGADGLEFIRRLLTASVQKAAPAGMQLYEIEYRQGSEVEKLAREAFPDAQVRVIKDLAGMDRLLEIQQKE